jgi:hypothetical protein
VAVEQAAAALIAESLAQPTQVVAVVVFAVSDQQYQAQAVLELLL